MDNAFDKAVCLVCAVCGFMVNMIDDTFTLIRFRVLKKGVSIFLEFHLYCSKLYDGIQGCVLYMKSSYVYDVCAYKRTLCIHY